MKRFKRILAFGLLLFLTGCASLQIPPYIPDKHPYTQRFYGEHQQVLEAVKKSLNDFGWQVDGTADPLVYEQTRLPEEGSENILLFTQIKQTSMFLWSSYVRLNVFISSKNKVSDVEVRYFKLKSSALKQFKGYRNDALSKKIFARINDYLNNS